MQAFKVGDITLVLQVAQYVLDHFQSLDPTSPFVFDSYKNVQRDFNKTVQTAMEGAANMTWAFHIFYSHLLSEKAAKPLRLS